MEEDTDGYPWEFYYNWASDMLYSELEELNHCPKDYLESMGWDPDEWLSRIDLNEVNYSEEDVMKLAGILKKYFEEYLEEEEVGDASIDAMYEDEVEDFIADTIAGCIQSAATSL